MKRGPLSHEQKLAHDLQRVAENSIPPFNVTLADIINMIFSHLPKHQYLPQRLLNKRCRKIIDLSLINSVAVQDVIQKSIQNGVDQQLLFDSQQREIDCLLSNKKAILNTPKLETHIVRPDEELIKAFKEVENLPKDNSIFSLYRRHVVLSNINLHIVFNTRDNNQLYDMFIFKKVIDFSGLYLTRLPRELFEMYIDKNFYNLSLVLNVSNNCLAQLPRSIIRLKNLRVLDLSGNQISSLPENINDFEELDTIFLANNFLKELPIGLVRLRKLKNLDIRRNSLLTLPQELESSILKRPRYTSAPLQSAHLDFSKYLSQLPNLCPISKVKVLATQKSQPDQQIRSLTNAFNSLKS